MGRCLQNNMIIKNEEIKELLKSKENLVKEGRELNVEIETKAQPIVGEFLKEHGIKELGLSKETYGKDLNYVEYKGTYLKLQETFKDSSVSVLQQKISTALADELEKLKALELQVQKLNDKISKIVTNLLPTLKLKEFEEPRDIKMIGKDVELVIINQLEEFKKRYKENKNK